MNGDGASLMPVRKVIDAKVAAGQLGVSLSMVYKLLRLGELEGYAVGRRKLIYADSLDAYRQRKAFGRAAAPEPAPVNGTRLRSRQRKEAVKKLALPARRHLR